MEYYKGSGDEEDRFTVEEDSPDEGFIQGYEDEDKVEECAECGAAINPEKRVRKKIDGEDYKFCSKVCAQEFEESLG